MALNETLAKVGLHEKEAAVFEALAQSGSATPAAIAKSTGINRATVYAVAQSLQAKGLLEADLGGKSVTFSIPSPENLEKSVEKDRRLLDERAHALKDLAGEVSKISAGKTYEVPKIRFVEEARLENFLYENIEEWQRDVEMGDGTWWGIQDYTFLERLSGWMEWYWNQPFSKKTKMRLVGNDAPVERYLEKHLPAPIRENRFVHDLSFTASVWLGGNRIVMIVTRNHPYHLVEIQDRTLAQNMREVFKKLWLDLGNSAQGQKPIHVSPTAK
jgi:predicted transcriptional regulator